MDIKALPLKRLVPWYLMASYLYYIHDVSLLEDSEYDAICQRLNKSWGLVSHRHKRLISRDGLAAGTGYYLREHDYPLICQSAAWQAAREMGRLPKPKLKLKFPTKPKLRFKS